eukprot:gb/GECH01012344.1/.p1 GENE.gb/GECH01012344.1/~~gb/GECH01012344.1/.p1  ORF type:complete len:325 (+),score=80.25 gb/GECH01012344.1/:1-975(+)
MSNNTKKSALSAKEFRDWLASISISSIAPRRDVVSLKEDDLIEDALKTLAYNQILSAPVYAKDKNEILGFIDVLDIVTFLMSLSDSGYEFPNKSSIDSYFRYAPLKKIIDASNKDPLCPVFEGGSILQLIEVFGTGVHRVPMYHSQEHDIVNIISQRDVFNFVYEHQDKLNHFPERTLEEVCFDNTELDFGRENLVSVSHSASVAKASSLLSENKVSALAVLDEQGDIVAHFSASDLRTLKDVSDLKLPILEFLDRYNYGPNTVVIEPNIKMKDLFEKIHHSNLHCIWVVEENSQKPFGVFSLTDIMNALGFEATHEDIKELNQ